MDTQARSLRNFLLQSLGPRPPILIRSLMRRMLYRPLSQGEVHAYWRRPRDGSNLPQDYLRHPDRSRFLVDLVTKYVDTGAHILEIGCNAGRNLIHLYQAGYRELAAVEISEAAVRLFRDSYPDVARHSDIYNAPVESVIEGFPDNAFDLVFTMAVLEHIHTESEWIFPEVARITGNRLVTIEDEDTVSERHFPRNYREVFEPLGLRQIERLDCGEDEGFAAKMVGRIFQREN